MFFEEQLLSEQLPLEEAISKACRSSQLPGIVLVANGENFHFEEAFGPRSTDGVSDEPLQTEASFVMAACTQLMTTIAALQCVERGLLELDASITSILPELGNKDILTGFDRKTDRPILVRSTKTITLRHLLTHTSGISYDTFSPLIRKWRVTQPRPPTSHIGRVTTTFSYPLIFEPGTSWSYGAGLDWVGKAIERVTRLSLSQYLTLHLFTPLSMPTATFHLSARPDVEATMIDFTHRLGLIHPLYNTLMARGGILISSSEADAHDVTTERGSSADSGSEVSDVSNTRTDDDFGGGGIYCSATDFARLLHALCACSDGSRPRILSPSSIDAIFAPQLTGGSLTALRSAMAIPEMSRALAGLEDEVLVDWGLGGLLVMEDLIGDMGEKKRRRGSLCGGAAPNIYWWIDRNGAKGAGVSGVYASQLLPQGDRLSVGMLGKFEETVYQRIDAVGRVDGAKGKGKEPTK